MASPRFVSLNRRFVDLKVEPTRADRWDPGVSPFNHSLEGYSWTELLDLRCAVVLAEAGSGKTAEFESQAERLAPTSPAFSATVTDLASEGVAALRRLDGFDTWLDGSAESGHLFLDSVDTALLEQQTLERALSKLRSEMRGGWNRCKVLLSCRGSDWRPEADAKTLEKFFPSIRVRWDGDVTGEPKQGYRVVRMLPLTLGQARTLAQDRLKGREDLFMEAVGAAQAETFLTRPLDVLMLVEIWRDLQLIPPLHELVPLVIEKKLRETNVQRPPSLIAPAALRDAARALAAAQIFCGSSHFRVGGEHSASPADIDPQRVLRDVAPNFLSELFTRALFDVATYGRARFHHRSLQEYLAAEWLLHLITVGCPIDDVLDLLFADVYGARVAIPSRAPVLAWVASKNSDVLKEAVRHAPEALLRWADPGALPVDSRRRVLSGIVGRRTSRWREDDATLRRFSHIELAGEISDLLKTPLIPDGAIVLLDVVRAGRLDVCATAALQLATDPSVALRVRTAAAGAVGAAGAEADTTALIAHVINTPRLDGAFLAAVCDALFPACMTVDSLLLMLRTASPQPADEPTGLGWHVAQRVREAVSPGQSIEVAGGILSILQQGGSDVEWLTACVLQIGVDLVNRSWEAVPETLITELIELRPSDTSDYRWRRFLDAINARADGRRRLFWYEVRRARVGAIKKRWRPYDFRYVTLGAEDVNWLLDDALREGPPHERVTAFSAAMSAARIGDGESDGARERFRAVCEKDEGLQRHFERRLASRTTRDDVLWLAPWRRRNAASALRRTRLHAANSATIRGSLRELRSGDAGSILWHLWNVMHEAESHDQWGVANANTLASTYDSEVAEAAVQGFESWWRRHTPQLPYERGQPNVVGADVLCGLAGILFLSRRPGAVAGLSYDEARRATRYACSEMNGFPGWFDELADVQPGAVAEVLFEAVAGEYRSVTSGRASGVLSKLHSVASHTRSRIGPALADLLAEPAGDPSLVSQLLAALADLPDIGLVVGQRAYGHLARDASPTSVVAWWPTWFRFAPVEACTFIEAWARSAHPSAPQQPTVGDIDVLGALSSALSSIADIETQADVLIRMVNLLVEVAPYSGDTQLIDDFGSFGTDGIRITRDRVIERLAGQPGAAVHRALEALAANSTGEVATRFVAMAQRRAQADAEQVPWRQDDVSAFGKAFRRVPQTDDDLFLVALARLRNVRRDLENGDFSPRRAYWGRVERDLQVWLAGELNLRSVGCYTVERESEVIDEKRTDIRLRALPDAKVTLELKRVQDYSVRELREALVSQLVGRYLRDHGSAYGVLVLCMNETKEWWDAPGGARWSLDDLVTHLGEYALEIVAASGAKVRGLRVVPIDFRRRTP